MRVKLYINIFCLMFFGNLCSVISQEFPMNDDKAMIYHFFRLRSGSHIKILSLQKAEFTEIVQKGQGEYRTDIPAKYEDVVAAYRLSDGKILVEVVNEYYSMFESEADMATVFNEPYMPSYHLLFRQNRFGQDFPAYTDSLITSLQEHLNLGVLSRDEEGLRTLSQALRKMNINERNEFIYTHVMEVIAYIGEVCIQKKGGSWYMELDADDGETWIPCIVANGRQSHFYREIYTIIDEYPESFDVITVYNRLTRDIAPRAR